MSINTPDTAPPWGWNPGATFLTAYYAAQENQRAKQEFAIAQELKQYLLPLEKQKAQLSLANMELQFERTKGELERQNILKNQEIQAVRNANRGVNSAVANGGSSNQAPAPSQQKTGYSNRLLQGGSDNQSILGSNLQPLDENE